MTTRNETILDDHRKMLTLSKQLSDFQLENLQKWPFIVFDGIKKNTVEYNFIDENDMFYAGIVTFNLESDIVEESHIKDHGRFLVDWAKILFWTDTQIEVTLNGKRINDLI